MNTPKIKIIKNGPYLVTGNIKLSEKIITPNGMGYLWTEGRSLPQSESYALCRCGQSKHAPFCDVAHRLFDFSGKETASKDPFSKRAQLLEGQGIDLLDDGRCAFARFCHRQNGDAWELTEESSKLENRKEAITAAKECPAGRLVALDKSGHAMEEEYEPAIEIIQDPEREVSGGIFVKGKIAIESENGELYEPRNRVVLCRCGHSTNKPFCDAAHVSYGFQDKIEK